MSPALSLFLPTSPGGPCPGQRTAGSGVRTWSAAMPVALPPRLSAAMLSHTRTDAPSLDRPQESGIEGPAGILIRCVHFSTDGSAGSVRNPLRHGESCVSGACPRVAVHVTRLRRENFPYPCASCAQGRNGLQEIDRTCCSLEVVASAADAPQGIRIERSSARAHSERRRQSPRHHGSRREKGRDGMPLAG